MSHYVIFCMRILLFRISWQQFLVVVRYLWDRNLKKRNIPFTAIMGITAKCQCNCAYCSTYDGGTVHKQDELENQEIFHCIDEIRRMGCVKVNFFGGEPLLHASLIAFIRYCMKVHLVPFMDTNGILLTAENVRALKKAGLTCVFISLDSVIREEHERIKRVECYDSIMAGINQCAFLKMPFVISTIVTPEKIQNGMIEKILSFAKTKKAWGVRLLLPMAKRAWKDNDTFRLSEHEQQMLQRIMKQASLYVYLESGYNYTTATMYSPAYCAALRGDSFYISPYGDVSLCYSWQRSYGNIRKKSLRDILVCQVNGLKECHEDKLCACCLSKE